MQIFALSHDLDCAHQERVAVFGALQSDSHDAQLATGRRLVLMAAATFFHETSTYSGMALQTILCPDAASFVPEPGHTYRATQTASLRSACRISILDSATGTPPPSIEPVDPTICLPA